MAAAAFQAASLLVKEVSALQQQEQFQSGMSRLERRLQP